MHVPFDDFKKLDLRVGTIIEVTEPEGSEKIYRLTVDLGEEIGKRIVFAGLKNFYEKEKLEGKQIVVLVNLAPKQFFGEEGQGMLLAVDEDGKPTLLKPDKKVKNGSIVR